MFTYKITMSKVRDKVEKYAIGSTVALLLMSVVIVGIHDKKKKH